MIGIFAVIGKWRNGVSNDEIKNIVVNNDTGLEFNISTHEDSIFAHNVLNKFKNDQIFSSDHGTTILLDGVILNSQQLLDKYNAPSLLRLFEHFIEKNCIQELLSEMRGSFCGLVFNDSGLFVFTDQLATKQLFYSYIDDSIIISSEVGTIVHFFKKQSISYSLDEIGAYSLMSYAYMYLNHTLIKEVKRLKEGQILQFCDNVHKITEYYKLKDDEIVISREDAIEEIDRLFLNAVRLQMEKNKEYGYMDVVPLSAGMDCRMTAFAARKISTLPMLNFTYSEYGQDDCVNPALMARELKNKWVFKSLDNGLDMLNIQESIQIADGLIYYLWPAQLNDVLKLINVEKWGVVHTGVIGDVILGCWHNRKTGVYKIGDGAYSTKYISKLSKLVSEESEVNDISYELGMFKNRAINGACMGYSTTFRRYCIDLSPFMNIDFINFCLSLPFDYRKDHSIYYEWVKKKYPAAAKFKHNGVTINGEIVINVKGQKIRIAAIKDIITRKIKRLQRDIFNKDYGMNPQDSWLKNNDFLMDKMNRYFEDHLGSLASWPEIYQDAYELYKTGNAVEKSLAISIVGSVGQFFC